MNRRGSRQRPRHERLDWSAIRARLQAAAQAPEAVEDPETILAERARRLARAPSAPPPADTLEVIQFQLAGEAYAVANARVREVCRTPPITPVPGAPAFILGIVNLRGAIYAVNDLATLLGLDGKPAGDAAGSLLVLANAEMELAVRVDQVTGVTHLTGQAAAGGSRRYVAGITPDGVALLDSERLLSDPDLIVSAE